MRLFLLTAFWALGVLLLAATSFTPRPALANHVVPACTFDINMDPATFTYMQTYEALDWKSVYGQSLELAGLNQLLPGVDNFGLPGLETGPRSAGSATLVDPYMPPTILKAIAWIESGWAQASYHPDVPYGTAGPVLVSRDCGYGVMQITSGMQKGSGVPTLDQAMIGGHYAFNIARGAWILAQKWNAAPEQRPLVGDRNPQIVENWFYAVWSYNGFAFKNHPLNPSFDPLRGSYLCDGTQSRSGFPFQELIFGCMTNPPIRDGVRLWKPLPATLPPLSQSAFSLDSWSACINKADPRYPDCSLMDIATPKPAHGDQTTTAAQPSQVLASPSMAVSPSLIVLDAEPGTQSGSLTFSISNGGSGVLAWRMEPTVPWLRVSQTQGVSVGSDLGSRATTVAVWGDARALPIGLYETTLLVESRHASNNPGSINVIFQVGHRSIVPGVVKP